MRRRMILPIALLGILLLGISSGALASLVDDVRWSVIAGGGGPIQSSGYRLNSTIGQGIVGSSASASYGLQSGYWSAFAGAAPAVTATPTRTPTLPPGAVPRLWLPVVVRQFVMAP
ncbi:MAG: hypothetical protein FJ026_11670 [Chloroflexi bacterium]|nr:hypothetical protein [Chloroflexota bacterium]